MLQALLLASCPSFYLQTVTSRASLLSKHARHKRLPRRHFMSMTRYNKTRQTASGDLLRPFQLAIAMSMRTAEISAYLLPLLWALCTTDRQHVHLFDHMLVFLSRCGGAFIKAGQWAATRPDIFPVTLCNKLSILHGDAPHHPHDWTVQVISKYPELRENLIVDTVIGSGTIGQVHRAEWMGQPVAVKVLHPHIHTRLDVDLQLMRVAVSVVGPWVCPPWIDLREEMAQFDGMMRQQLDLRLEGRTLRRFATNFRFSRLPVRFPRVLFAGPDVLVEEYYGDDCISGSDSKVVRMNDFVNKCDDEQLKERVAVCGVKAFVKMMLWDNFVHADLHPGNMMVRVGNNKNRSHFELIFLDTGLVTELGTRDHENFKALFKALVVDGDGEAAGRLIATRIPQPYLQDQDGFAKRVGVIAAPVLSSRFAIDRERGLRLAPLLMAMMEAVREYKVRLDPAFTNLIWSMVCVEGLGRQLAPTLPLQPVILQAALQFVVTEAVRSIVP